MSEVENKRTVGILTAGHFFIDSYSGFITPVLPFIAQKLDITIAIVSVIMSMAHLASSVMQPIFGYISDIITRRFFIIWGLILASLFICLTGVVSNVWSLALCIIIGCVGVAFYHPQASSLTARFSGHNLNKNMGLFIACGTLGYASGPIISSFLVEKFGLESIIWGIIPGFTIALLVWIYMPKIPKIERKEPVANIFNVFKYIVKNKDMMILTVIAVIKSLIVMTFCTYMPFLWKSKGYNVFLIGNIIGLFSLVGGVSSYISGQIANKLGKKNVFYISLIFMTVVGLSCLHFVNIFPKLSLFLFVVTGFFTNFSVGINMSMAQQALPEYKGVVSGIIGGLSWGLVGLCLAPLGFVVSHFGIQNVLSVIAIVPILGVLFVKNISKELCSKI